MSRHQIISILTLLLFTFIGNAQPESDIAALEAALMAFGENANDPVGKAEIADKLAFEFILKNELESALHYNQVSEQLKAGSDQSVFLKNYRHLGLIYTRMRHFPRAKLYLEKALRHALDDRDELNQARLYADLGDWYYRLKNYEEATQNYHSALTLFTTLPDQDNNVAFVKMALGAVYFDKGSPGRASIEYEDARVILVRAFGDNDKSLIPLLTGEGKALMAYGDFALAESRLIEALEITENTFGRNHVETAKALINLAILELKLGKTDQAERFGNDAISLLTENPEGEGDRISHDDELIRLREVQAHIYLDRFSNSGEAHFLTKADSIIRHGLKTIDNALMGFSFELDRMNFVKRHQSLYDLALSVDKMKWNNSTSKSAISENAFQTVERSKAQVLNSLVHDVQVKKISGIPEDLIQKEHTLKNSLNRLKTQQALLTPASPEYATLSEALLTTRNDYEAFITKMETDFPQYFNLRYRKTEVTLGHLRSVLGKNDALISYYLESDVFHIFYVDLEEVIWLTYDKDVIFEGQEVYKPESKFKIFNQTIFGKKKGPDIETVPVPTKIIDTQPSYALDDAIQFYTKSIRKFEKELFIKSSRSLYEKLIYPIEGKLKNKKHLIIIPDGELHNIPFEALLTKALQSGKSVKYNKLPYLIKDFTISYHHSAGLFYETRLMQIQNEKTFVGFAPVFDDSLRNGWVWNSKDYLRDTTYYLDYSNLRAISNSGKRKFKELKYSKDEVVSIAKLFAKDDDNAEVFLYGEASEGNFKSKTEGTDIVHVASHSFVDFVNPESSGLAFAQNEKHSTEDGILYTPETFSLKLSADLLVLSSCESGAGKIAEGEGLLSLTRGFLFSGAKNALVSLWRISDRTTSRFMVDFYKSLLTDQKTYSKALRAAKLKAINNEKTAAPRYWSSFVLIGR
ncbi:MAG: CHAT domain-containing tetratricopeptide repeat protein [Bacteroidota bacterium]